MDESTLWLSQPVMLHSSRMDMCELTPEQCAYRSGHWRYWYIADYVYALPTVYFFLAAIGLCLLGFWALRFSPARLRRTGWWQRSVGLVRYAAYRRYEVGFLGRWHTPSLAVMMLLGAGAVFFLAMTFGPKPYYWPNTKTLSYGNSPPIATRTGYMALGCTPFVVILSTKANMIATLTGVSHERLIVYHNWVAWAMLVLALIHTFPFIVYHIWKGDMVEEWNSSVNYWTGVVALIPQAYLTFMSVPWIRNAYYEFFKATHFAAAIIFMVFFFLHCSFTLTSWDYFIAAGVLYTISWLYSQIRTYFEHGVSLRASVTPASDRAVKITVPVNGLTWEPGSHVFLRFLSFGLHSLTAHPFTICSTPSTSKDSKSALVFYVQPRGGITGRLAAAAAKQPGVTFPVLIEGPYGGVKTRPLYTYDRGLVVACGAGAGFAMPFIVEWLRKAGTDAHSSGRRLLRVLISTRDEDMLEWFEEGLEELLAANGLAVTMDGVEVAVYVTGGGGSGPSLAGGEEKGRAVSPQQLPASPQGSDEEKNGDDKTNGEKQVLSSTSTRSARRLPLQVVRGQRAEMGAAVRAATMDPEAAGGSVGIAACGPAGVLKAVQDEAAAAQLRILEGGAGGAKEVYLHSEVFSW